MNDRQQRLEVPRRLISVAAFVATMAGLPLQIPAQVTTTSRDSAGIRIVENRLRGEAPIAFTLSQNPILEFGGESTDSLSELYAVSDALRLPDGRIVVGIQKSPASMRMFDRNGKFLSTIARGGQGPGELPGWPDVIRLLPGDTIAASVNAQRMLLFNSEGRLVRMEAMAGNAPPAWLRTGHLFAGRTATGTALRYASKRPEPGSPPDSGIVVAHVPRSALVNLTIPAVDTQRPVTAFVVPPFGRRLSAAALDGDRFVVGDGESFQLRIHDETGALRTIIRRDADLAVRTADIEEFRTTVVPHIAPARRAPIDRWLSTIEMPKTKPAFVSIVVDRAGRIWTEIAASGYGQPYRYSVFEPGGRLLGNVMLPSGVVPYDFGADYILAGFTDSDGFRRLRIYTLSATATPATPAPSPPAL